MRKTFREYVEFKEAAMPATNVKPDDQKTDDEIINNPQLLQSKMVNPQATKPIIDQAVANKKQNPRASLDAALKAAAMAKKRLN